MSATRSVLAGIWGMVRLIFMYDRLAFSAFAPADERRRAIRWYLGGQRAPTWLERRDVQRHDAATRAMAAQLAVGLQRLASESAAAAAAVSRTAAATSRMEWPSRAARARRYARLEGLDVPPSWEVEREGFMRGLPQD